MGFPGSSASSRPFQQRTWVLARRFRWSEPDFAAHWESCRQARVPVIAEVAAGTELLATWLMKRAKRERETDREAERGGERQRERHAEGGRERERDGETEREREMERCREKEREREGERGRGREGEGERKGRERARANNGVNAMFPQDTLPMRDNTTLARNIH